VRLNRDMHPTMSDLEWLATRPNESQARGRRAGRISGSILVALAGLLAATSALSAPKVALTTERPDVVLTTFASVDATIAGQWDFPTHTPAPLIVLIPGGGRLDRNGWTPGMGEDSNAGIYAQLTKQLVASGFAVFRYDKPGAGRSSPGRYATERSNALEAYTHAVQHARVDPDRVFLLGHGLGTDTIAAIYPRFAAVRAPAGVVLLDNSVGETDSLRISAPAIIVNPAADPDDRLQYGQFVAEARQRAENGSLPTKLVLLENAERGLLAQRLEGEQTVYSLDSRATDAVVRWLMERRG
jgi:pimeloyl-ACP methyl ester carboxylesterase